MFFYFIPVVFAVLYILFNIYLVIHMAANMGNQALLNSQVSFSNDIIVLFCFHLFK